MPGMMDTILNLGLNDRSVLGLVQRSGNPRFAWDCYRRFLQMFGSVVLGLEKGDFEEHLEAFKKKKRAKTDQDLTAEDLQALVEGVQGAGEEAHRPRLPAGSARAARACRATPCSAPG